MNKKNIALILSGGEGKDLIKKNPNNSLKLTTIQY